MLHSGEGLINTILLLTKEKKEKELKKRRIRLYCLILGK